MVWLTLLFKKWPIANITEAKYRPIGAGTGLQRCITAVDAKMESPNFAQACLESNNFGIGVRGGAQLVAFSLLAECQCHVFKMHHQLEEGDIPNKCLLSLDMNNIFSNMSRKKCRNILKLKFPHLVCLFDALSKRANKVIICKEDSTLETFLQLKGYAQGCPLSSIFSALVFGELLKQLNTQQSACTLTTPTSANIDRLVSKIIA
eukprot:580390-Ditylum_brightwellii.AAC.1